MESRNWTDAAIRDHFEQGLSYSEIAQKYGRNQSTIAKLLARERKRRAANGEPLGRKPRNRPDPRAFANLTRLSPTHARVGARLNYYRTVTKQLTPTALGDLLSVSRSLIGKMEAGAHDFTLTELWKIAQLLGSPSRSSSRSRS